MGVVIVAVCEAAKDARFSRFSGGCIEGESVNSTFLRFRKTKERWNF